MVNLLDDASETGLIVLCIIMSVVALFLAIAICYELFFNKKRRDVNTSTSPNRLNIKEDTNIKYEELTREEEKAKAKEELERLKADLILKQTEENITNNYSSKTNTDNENKIDLAVKNYVENINKNEDSVSDDTKELKVINNEELEKISKENNVSKEEKVETNKEVNKEINNINIKETNINKEVTNVDETKVTNDSLDISKIDEKVKEKIIDEYLKSVEDNTTKVVNNTIIDEDDTFKENKSNNIETSKDEEIEIIDANSNIEVNNKEKNTNEENSVYQELEEENAIISYDELKKATEESNFGYTDEEMNNYDDEKDAIISFDELYKLYNEINSIKEDNKVNKGSIVIPAYEFKEVKDLPEISSEKIFKKSDFISPIYGKDIEKKDNLARLNEEIKKTNEFLKMLKELKKNLE